MNKEKKTCSHGLPSETSTTGTLMAWQLKDCRLSVTLTQQPKLSGRPGCVVYIFSWRALLFFVPLFRGSRLVLLFSCLILPCCLCFFLCSCHTRHLSFALITPFYAFSLCYADDTADSAFFLVCLDSRHASLYWHLLQVSSGSS